MTEADVGATPGTETCAQCGRSLTAGDRVAAGDKVFCRSCYASLRAELQQAVGEMSSGINYVNGAIGAVLGAAVGGALWWGFTVVTKISLGLVALAIGFLAGLGAVKFAGGKRSGTLQAISIVAALGSYLVASYLVNMTFANQALAKQGDAFRVAFPPQSFDLFVRVLSLGFGMMDLVFLAIVVYEAWKIPKPLALPPDVST
jgi:hypothetical protein